MKRIEVWTTSMSLTWGVLAFSPAWAGMADDKSPYPARYHDHYEITASDGMLIGGEGRTGDSMRYRGKRIWQGPGTASVLVDERNNAGIVMGSIRTKGHTYTVLMDQFHGAKPFQSGGIARFVELHGLTKHGAPILPKLFAYLAGWGSPCTVWKDSEVLYDDFACHFMLTETVRDPETGEIQDFPGKEEISKLLKAERWQGDNAPDRNTRREITKSADSDHTGLQLHLIAHTEKQNPSNLPPYETAMHFMWNDVQWWSGPQTSMADAQAGWSDSEIAGMIKRELKNNRIIDSRDIEVTVTNGRVTLTGTADSPFEKNNAYFSAWVPGVKAVTNQIVIQDGLRLSDREVQQAVLEAYALDPRIVHAHPDVKVKDGVLTLEGTVADAKAKRTAEEVAGQFAGVREVRNQLNIDKSLARAEASNHHVTGVSQDDWQLKRDIESELTWSPFVDADLVQVTVRDGVAFLFGTVEDRDEMQAAVENAYEAGADRVENHMTIEHS